jgi:RND family efflux transporter MFP subunit
MVLVPREVAETRSFSGEVRARNQIVLSTKISGYVKEVFVEEGDQVEAGAPLLHIDDQPIKDQLKSLQAALAAVQKEKEAVSARKKYAESHFRRLQRLWAEQAATKEEYEQAEAEYQALVAKERALVAKMKDIRADLAKTRNILSYTFLKSPVKALVTRRLADPGSFVVAHTPVIFLDDLSSGFRFHVDLDEQLLFKVKKGQKYWILFPGLGEGRFGVVSEVVKKIDPQTRTFVVKLDLEGPGLHSGLYGRLYFPLARRKALLVPWRAVVTRGDLTGVMVVEKDGLIRFRVLRLGTTFCPKDGGFWPEKAPQELALARKTDLWVEVLAGVSPEERIVTSRLSEVRD